MFRPKCLTYFTSLISLMIGLSTYAGDKKGLPVSYYFGYYLESSIDSSTINILEKEGYEIVETDSVDKIIYVKNVKV